MAIIQNTATMTADNANRVIPVLERNPKGPMMRHRTTAAIWVTIIATANGMPPEVYLRYSQYSATPTAMIAIIININEYDYSVIAKAAGCRLVEPAAGGEMR